MPIPWMRVEISSKIAGDWRAAGPQVKEDIVKPYRFQFGIINAEGAYVVMDMRMRVDAWYSPNW